MSAPELSNARVTIETTKASKVICVAWELADEKIEIDGEWLVEWDDMYPELPEDVQSAPGAQGGYAALQKERASSEASNPSLSKLRDAARADEPIPTGPLSTARLLEFENGPNLGELQDDLPTFFAARPVVQAPEHILSDSSSVSKKTEVLFLLADATPVPSSVRIFFIPTWTPPNTPPTLLAEIPEGHYGPPSEQGTAALHTAWSTKRLEDLKALQDIANELELEGSRGTTKGRLKVGVEGGGMDEEAVRREGWMVGEEQVWVVEKFLTSKPSPKEEESAVMDPFTGLGISTGMHFPNTSSVRPAPPGLVEEEEEEDLFALPLSPRSPDMTMSPFSMFRGDVLPSSKPPFSSKLRQVESIDAAAISMGLGLGLPTTTTTTTMGEPRAKTAGAPPTPPRDA
ncbi:hypothetical protein BZA05DRAFT_442417 [Tricharina praecox]|uniref:uncharacterized protein n=1 Tax=Tricharina praecox TaxID=43433 RepID=UPI00221F5D55|nr:uncharacterized protein BZA05DRAFT_442417 [Tricharina praecox]KAI5855723.1 hypothetical protein BZA05DRAFT_442417 [Tricharina praecox]